MRQNLNALNLSHDGLAKFSEILHKSQSEANIWLSALQASKNSPMP